MSCPRITRISAKPTVLDRVKSCELRLAEFFAQPARPIGRDAVHSSGHQFSSRSYHVHGPNVEPKPSGSDFPDKVGVDGTISAEVQPIQPCVFGALNKL